MPAAPLPRLLVVEDNADSQMIIRLFLEGRYDVDIAPSYDSAMSHVSDNRYDAFVLDIALEGERSGLDVLRLIRSMPIYERAPTIACTAFALPQDRENLLSEGFDEYVSKPFRSKTLKDALSRALGDA